MRLAWDLRLYIKLVKMRELLLYISMSLEGYIAEKRIMDMKITQAIYSNGLYKKQLRKIN